MAAIKIPEALAAIDAALAQEQDPRLRADLTELRERLAASGAETLEARLERASDGGPGRAIFPLVWEEET